MRFDVVARFAFLCLTLLGTGINAYLVALSYRYLPASYRRAPDTQILARAEIWRQWLRLGAQLCFVGIAVTSLVASTAARLPLTRPALVNAGLFVLGVFILTGGSVHYAIVRTRFVRARNAALRGVIERRRQPR